MPDRFIHFSNTPLTALRSVDPASRHRADKPGGLWFSVGDGEDGWRAWCEAEDFYVENLIHRTEILFAPDARLLRVSGAAALDAFTQRFGIECKGFGRGYGIDWRAVGESYDAIAITPYVYECRLHPEYFWYYSWDCASGCVWNAKAVAELRALVGSDADA